LPILNQANAKPLGGSGSTVTIEFNRADGKRLEIAEPGKRTETGTVIKLTAQQITLQVPSISFGNAGAGTPGMFLIDIHTPNDTIVTGTLAVGKTVKVESNQEDWHQVAA
jgi:hypothetical protein